MAEEMVGQAVLIAFERLQSACNGHFLKKAAWSPFNNDPGALTPVAVVTGVSQKVTGRSPLTEPKAQVQPVSGNLEEADVGAEPFNVLAVHRATSQKLHGLRRKTGLAGLKVPIRQQFHKTGAGEHVRTEKAFKTDFLCTLFEQQTKPVIGQKQEVNSVRVDCKQSRKTKYVSLRLEGFTKHMKYGMRQKRFMSRMR